MRTNGQRDDHRALDGLRSELDEMDDHREELANTIDAIEAMEEGLRDLESELEERIQGGRS